MSLTDVALRRRTEPERGLYIAESQKVIRRALARRSPPAVLPDGRAVGHRPRRPRRRGRGRRHPGLRRGPRRHRGAHRLPPPPRRPRLDAAPGAAECRGGRGRSPARVVVEDVVDHTNVGAIFRSAAALGAEAVLVSPRCADPLYRRSIRVSMGTVFQVPWTRIDPWPEGVAAAARAGFRRRRDGPHRRLRLPRRARGARPPTASHSSWAPRVTACRPAPWPRPTSRCASRWRAGSTRSTWPLPPPSRCGRCACAADDRSASPQRPHAVRDEPPHEPVELRGRVVAEAAVDRAGLHHGRARGDDPPEALAGLVEARQAAARLTPADRAHPSRASPARRRGRRSARGRRPGPGRARHAASRKSASWQ